MTIEAFQENTAASKHLGNLHNLWTGSVWDDWYLEDVRQRTWGKKKKKKKQQEKVEGLKLKSDFILDPWDVDREVWREKRRWTKFWLDFSSTHFKSSEIFSSISIAHYYKCNLHRSSLHSSLIFHHLYFISKGLKKGVIVQSQDLKRMKAGDSATAISKHNYISYGLPSLDDLKRLRALPFSRLVERERAVTFWTKTFGNNLENISRIVLPKTWSFRFLDHVTNALLAFRQLYSCGNPDLECRHRCWLCRLL